MSERWCSSIPAIHLANIIKKPTKQVAFPSKCKIEKIKTLFKKEIKAEAKNYR